MNYEIYKIDTPELVAVSIDCDYMVTFSTSGGMLFNEEPLSLVDEINANMGTEFVGARPVRKPK